VSMRRAVIFSSLERYYGFAVAFATTIVISRLLTPAEVGAFSVAMSLAGVAGGLREFGASSFLIRSTNMTRHHQSCAFGLTLLLGGTLGLLMLIMARPIAEFFGQGDVATLLRILSLNFFLLPLGTVNNALIQRAMRFDLVARIGMIAVSLSFFVSVGLAWLGFGAYSLAWSAVALSGSSALLSIVWGPEAVVIRPSLRGAGELIRFGSQTSGLSLLLEVSSRFPDFILGKMQSFDAAGLMSRAMGLAGNLNDLMLKGLAVVTLSFFSGIEREKGDVIQAHVRVATLVTGLGWPAFIGLAFFAEPLTLALYGDQWLGIVWPLRILCIQFCCILPFSFQVQVVMAKDCMPRQIRASILSVAIKVVCLTVAAHWGVIGVAIGLLITQIASILISARMVWPALGVRWSDYWRGIRPNFLPLGVAVLSSSLALVVADHQALSRTVLLLGFGLLAGLAVIGSYFLAGHPIAREAQRILAELRTKTP